MKKKMKYTIIETTTVTVLDPVFCGWAEGKRENLQAHEF